MILPYYQWATSTQVFIWTLPSVDKSLPVISRVWQTDIVFEISKFPQYGTVTIDSLDGNWTYLPNHKDFGDDVFEISVADQNGDKTFQTIYVFAQINHPIVTTLQPVETASGSIILSGELISTLPGSTVMDLGFCIDDSPDFSDFQKISLGLDSNFSVQYFDTNVSMPTEIIYLRAYASTEHGDFFGQKFGTIH